MTLAAIVALGGNAWATTNGEITVTGVISKAQPALRHAVITPRGGKPIPIQFVWNVGGVCKKCKGGGLKQPVFDETIANGSSWTVVYTPSYPDGDVNTVVRVRKPGEVDTGPQRGVARPRSGEGD
jgi:hypothetical protein